MSSKIKCQINEIVAELSEPNSRNEQKVLAFAEWNDNGETVNIRKFNAVDKILLGGISLSVGFTGDTIPFFMHSQLTCSGQRSERL